VRCLLEALTVGGVARAAGEAGVVLDPLTAQLLDAWAAFGRTCGDEGSDGGGGGGRVGSGGAGSGGTELVVGGGGGRSPGGPRARLKQQLAEMRRQRQRQARPRGDDPSAIADAGAQLDPPAAAAGSSSQDGRGDGSGAHSHSAAPRDFESSSRRYASAARKQVALRTKAQPFVPAQRGRQQHGLPDRLAAV
jgi:hypothetical protein